MYAKRYTTAPAIITTSVIETNAKARPVTPATGAVARGSAIEVLESRHVIRCGS